MGKKKVLRLVSRFCVQSCFTFIQGSCITLKKIFFFVKHTWFSFRGRASILLTPCWVCICFNLNWSFLSMSILNSVEQLGSCTSQILSVTISQAQYCGKHQLFTWLLLTLVRLIWISCTVCYTWSRPADWLAHQSTQRKLLLKGLLREMSYASEWKGAFTLLLRGCCHEGQKSWVWSLLLITASNTKPSEEAGVKKTWVANTPPCLSSLGQEIDPCIQYLGCNNWWTHQLQFHQERLGVLASAENILGNKYMICYFTDRLCPLLGFRFCVTIPTPHLRSGFSRVWDSFFQSASG